MDSTNPTSSPLLTLLVRAQTEVRQAESARGETLQAALENADDALVEALKVAEATMVKQAPPLKGDEGRILHLNGKVERRIVWNLIEQLEAADFRVVAVDDGEERVKCADNLSAMEAVFAVDEATLVVKRQGSREHGIKLVLGNGEDVISDWNYSTGDKDKFNAFMDTFDPSENY